MLTIRFQRVGKRNRPSFRVVLAEKSKSAKKKTVEVLGFYDPRSKELVISNQERVKYWMGQHVPPSPSVNNLLVEKGIISGNKVKAWRPKVKKAEEAAAPAVAAEEPKKEEPAPAAPA